MKKALKFTLLATMATLPLITTGVVLSSCVSNKSIDYSDTIVAKYYNSFILENHGRWAGNEYNFSNVKEDKTGLNGTAQPKYDLSTKIEESVNNYGSYHAYLWLVDTITKMGYENLNKDVTDLQEATISNNSTGNGKTVTPAEGTTANGNIIYSNNNISESLLYKTGLVTQPFLWNRSNSYNNRGRNILVTINSNESIQETNELTDFFIVAHFDSTSSGGDQKSWGATDNGTGVAMNLAILKHFSDPTNRTNLKSRVHLLFSDAEEVGVLGTNAFVSQFLGTNSKIKPSTWGMINLDTIAGGDVMYVHSPDTRKSDANKQYNTKSGLRSIVQEISKNISQDKKDSEYELQIHEQYVDTEYKAGETGDWSDHAPFYKDAGIPIAYIESTNFALKSKYDTFDGYSQTTNPNAWLLKDGTPVVLRKTTNEKGQTIWVLPEGLTLNDFKVKGDIWHSDLDRIDWLNKNIGEQKIYKQLNIVFDTLVTLLTIQTPTTIK